MPTDSPAALADKIQSCADIPDGVPWSQEELDLIEAALRAYSRRALPGEPTRAMLDAWGDAMRGHATHRPSTLWPGVHYSDSESLMVDAYQAMLAVAPKSETQTPIDRELLGGVLNELHNLCHRIEHIGDFHATKNGPFYRDARRAHDMLTAALFPKPEKKNADER